MINLKRAKTGIITLSAVLIFANMFVLNGARELSRSLNDLQSETTWFLFQLTKEFAELASLANNINDVPEYYSTLELKYELTWSRFDLVMTGRESSNLLALPQFKTFIPETFEQFKSLEPLLVKSVNNPIVAAEFGKELNRVYVSTINFVNQNFKLKNPLYQKQQDRVLLFSQLQFALVLLTIASALTIAFILHKESTRHRLASLTDPLTGQHNRLALFQYLDEVKKKQQVFTLFMLDLNGFKSINDSYGHHAGDKALKIVVERLRQLTVEEYQFFRIGGDEFALVIESTSRVSINQMKAEIQQSFVTPFQVIQSKQSYLSTSIGTSQYPKDGDDIHHLLEVADSRMYSMKFSQ
ncbi:GGDEF domain-containing protein [Aliivibrio kagoshimensis]|uniref:GGDEF domain-containing protein n=1 Tax=Aliivibrio kagoshimensis TaxID=2910230 RepID=UPI003D14E29F